MAKGQLTFDLPKEAEDFERASKALQLSLVYSEVDNWLRSLSKYENQYMVSIEEVRKRLYDELVEHGVADIVGP